MAGTQPGLLRRIAGKFSKDQVTAQSAALSFYVTLALAPALLLVLTLMSVLPADTQQAAVSRMVEAGGEEIGPFLRTLLDNADERPALRNLAGWLSLAIVLVGASALFVRLQESINRIWQAEDRHLAGLWATLQRRLWSVVLLVTLVAISIAAMVAQRFLPEGEPVWLVLGWIASVLVYIALFAAMYRFLPDRRVAWPTVLRAGAITALLFMVGRTGLGFYFAYSDVAGAFGMFGTVIVWLVWAYYMGIVFLGAAVLVYVLAERRGWRWFDDGGDGGPSAPVRPVPRGIPA